MSDDEEMCKLNFLNVTNNSVTFTCKKLDNSVLHYTVMVRIKKVYGYTEWVLSYKGNDVKYTQTQLLPGVTYQFKLRVQYHEDFEGSFGDYYTVTTTGKLNDKRLAKHPPILSNVALAAKKQNEIEKNIAEQKKQMKAKENKMKRQKWLAEEAERNKIAEKAAQEKAERLAVDQSKRRQAREKREREQKKKQKEQDEQDVKLRKMKELAAKTAKDVRKLQKLKNQIYAKEAAEIRSLELEKQLVDEDDMKRVESRAKRQEEERLNYERLIAEQSKDEREKYVQELMELFVDLSKPYLTAVLQHCGLNYPRSVDLILKYQAEDGSVRIPGINVPSNKQSIHIDNKSRTYASALQNDIIPAKHVSNFQPPQPKPTPPQVNNNVIQDDVDELPKLMEIFPKLNRLFLHECLAKYAFNFAKTVEMILTNQRADGTVVIEGVTEKSKPENNEPVEKHVPKHIPVYQQQRQQIQSPQHVVEDYDDDEEELAPMSFQDVHHEPPAPAPIQKNNHNIYEKNNNNNMHQNHISPVQQPQQHQQHQNNNPSPVIPQQVGFGVANNMYQQQRQQQLHQQPEFVQQNPAMLNNYNYGQNYLNLSMFQQRQMQEQPIEEDYDEEEDEEEFQFPYIPHEFGNPNANYMNNYIAPQEHNNMQPPVNPNIQVPWQQQQQPLSAYDPLRDQYKQQQQSPYKPQYGAPYGGQSNPPPYPMQNQSYPPPSGQYQPGNQEFVSALNNNPSNMHQQYPNQMQGYGQFVMPPQGQQQYMQQQPNYEYPQQPQPNYVDHNRMNQFLGEGIKMGEYEKMANEQKSGMMFQNGEPGQEPEQPQYEQKSEEEEDYYSDSEESDEEEDDDEEEGEEAFNQTRFIGEVPVHLRARFKGAHLLQMTNKCGLQRINFDPTNGRVAAVGTKDRIEYAEFIYLPLWLQKKENQIAKENEKKARKAKQQEN